MYDCLFRAHIFTLLQLEKAVEENLYTNAQVCINVLHFAGCLAMHVGIDGNNLADGAAKEAAAAEVEHLGSLPHTDYYPIYKSTRKTEMAKANTKITRLKPKHKIMGNVYTE